ncbi:MAG: hypothetical protein IJP29_08505 [Lachnospiraceae bacterium]|nr:hypothetical protein [Lachnospiraceae bacterium]
MSTKLYNKDLQIREITVEEFDAIEGNHKFSDKYENKKAVVLEAFKQKSPKKMKRAMKVAAAAIAVIICSGTALATNGTYLREFYESRLNGIDEKYVDDSFFDATYDLPVEVQTDDESGLLDFQVLQIAKSTHTIAIATVVTVNHPESYEKATSYDVGLDLELVGMEEAHWQRGCGNKIDWDSSGLYGKGIAQELGLKKNQVLILYEYQYEDDVDLSQVEEANLTWRHVSYIKQDPANEEESVIEWIDNETEWTMKVGVRQDYSDRVVELNQRFHIGKREFQIEKIHVTSFGIGFLYEKQHDFTWEMKEEIPTDCTINDHYDKFKLVMSDGNKVAMTRVCEERAGYDGDSGYAIDEFQFKVPLDVEQIVGVEIDGTLVELK